MRFNETQQRIIKTAIEFWFLIWDSRITEDYMQHRFGAAKEYLKLLICPASPCENFTEKEVDYICYEIGDWYIKWKPKIMDKEKKRHYLKKALKDLQKILLEE